MQLFYNKDIKNEDSHFSFNKEESKHIVKVLRKKEGDIIRITNGKGAIFKAKLSLLDTRKCTVSILENELFLQPKYQLHLAIAPTKMNDRFEWFLEKATEIGISTITPILCDNSERKSIKLERFERIIISAMKQSLQCYLPKIEPLTPFKTFIKTHKAAHKFIAHCEDSNKQSLQLLLSSNTDYTILIGPEGDFSTKEIDLALRQKYIPVSLGNSRLRTETAGIVACHTVALINQL